MEITAARSFNTLFVFLDIVWLLFFASCYGKITNARRWLLGSWPA